MIKVHHSLKNLPSFNKAVITIGTFDGVHLGHRQIIRLLKEEAATVGGETVIITFHPHPRKIIAGGSLEVKILNTLDEKISLLDKFGLNHVVVVPFTDEFSNLSAEDYIKNFLVKNFSPQTIIIGYDHKFGKNRLGNYQLLEEMGAVEGFGVKEISEQMQNDIIISSTKIREALLKSNVSVANTYLGYHYFFSGIVKQGMKIGRTLGFPTANIQVSEPEKLIPANGVYAVRVSISSMAKSYNGMMNIGVRPTFNNGDASIEVHIFDFNADVYGKEIRVELVDFIRHEQPFDNVQQLRQQLEADKITALDRLL